MFQEIITPEKYVPSIFSPLDDRRLDSYLLYTVKAGGQVPPKFTGKLMGRLIFKDGIANTNKHFLVKLALMRGCEDITPPRIKEQLVNRPLNKILIIRNAAFGDCTILTPALHAMRIKYPNAIIHLFGRKDSRVVYEYLPFIDGILNIRETELGTILDEYDEVFDLVHTIECCPEADYKNALDVVSSLLDVEIKDSKPQYVLTQNELKEANAILSKQGIIVGKDSLICIQTEATAKVRTLSNLTTLEVANNLALQGHKALIVNMDVNLLHTKIVECKECKHRLAEFVLPGIIEIAKHCIKCQKDSYFQVFQNHQNVSFLSVHNERPPRIRFAIAHYAKLIIAVDSFWSHLAAALSKPSVIVFTNYHPFTRTKYYDDSIVVAPNYKKDVPCGPCNGLVDVCHLYPKSQAACVTAVTSDLILNAVNKRLKSENLLYQELRDIPPALIEEKERDCPYCNSSNYEPVTCKGNYIYVQCIDCKSMYTHKLPEYKKEFILEKTKNNKFYRESRNFPFIDFIENLKTLFANLNLPYPSIPITCFRGLIESHTGHEDWSEKYKNWVFYKQENGMSKIDTQLNIWVDGILECETPVNKLIEFARRLKKDSYLVLINPLTDKYDKLNTWKPLNGPIAGLISNIPSAKAFEYLFKKDQGTHRNVYELVGSAYSELTSMVVLKVVLNEISS